MAWACALFAALAGPATALGEPGVLERAKDYTVKIHGVVETPFIEDDRGAYKAAGFLVDASRGWIVTNTHIASRSPVTLRVAFEDQRPVKAQRVYVDPHLDLAVLAIPQEAVPDNTPTAKLACDGGTSAGTSVAALGHPWQVSFTATRGIVSGHAVIEEAEWLQTDAPLNSGNSGGPLIDTETGQVVGINGAHVVKKGTESLGFAVPSQYACRILALLRRGVDPSPPDLPVVFVTGESHKQTLTVARTYFQDDPPLRTGDVILGVGTEPKQPENRTQFFHMLRGKRGPTTVWIERDGERKQVTISVTPMASVLDREGILVSGVLLANAAMRDIHEFRRTGPGVMVHSVRSGSLGGLEGFGAWDLIERVDGRRFDETEALVKYLRKQAKDRSEVDVLVRRRTDRIHRWFEYRELQLSLDKLRQVAVQP